MKRFLLMDAPDKDGLIRIKGRDYHYLVNVRRILAGDTFSAALPCGRDSLFQAISIERNVLTGKVTTLSRTKDEAPAWESLPKLMLFQAMPKESKMDLIIRQAAEGGISEIVPFIAERSIYANGKKRFRIDRWRRVIKEARQQSGSRIDTRVQPPLSADDLFKFWKDASSETNAGEGNGALGIAFHSPPLEQTGFHHYLNKETSLIVLAVGPEGGFSCAELNRFKDAGFKFLSMGESILRTETAALYAAAAVKIILMERAWWTITQK